MEYDSQQGWPHLTTTSELRQLMRRIRELEEALRPFVAAYEKWASPAPVEDNPLVRCAGGYVEAQAFERARELLACLRASHRQAGGQGGAGVTRSRANERR